MKKIVLWGLMLSAGSILMEAQAQSNKFEFTTLKQLPITSIKDQHRSGTCWCHSSLGYFEAELLRQGKGTYDLCESFVIHKTYEDRAKASVRLHGDIAFLQGGKFSDVVYCIKHYGIAPQNAMPQPGSLYGDSLLNFNEFFPLAQGYVDGIAKGKQKKLSPTWLKGLVSILDTYLGEVPETFDYNGTTYTPETFRDMLGLNMDDYVPLTSYSHHPFYEPFILEIQDNWRWAKCYNIPIDELMEVISYAVDHGFPVAWSSDVSEDGFTRNGIAVCPDVTQSPDLSGSDMAHWLGLTNMGKMYESTSRPCPEIEVTQDMRQDAYDYWENTDDHSMVIFGLAKDQTGKEYYMAKNSWGDSGNYHGIWYASKTFVKYKTMNIMVHKDGVPSKKKKKIGWKR